MTLRIKKAETMPKKLEGAQRSVMSPRMRAWTMVPGLRGQVVRVVRAWLNLLDSRQRIAAGQRRQGMHLAPATSGGKAPASPWEWSNPNQEEEQGNCTASFSQEEGP